MALFGLFRRRPHERSGFALYTAAVEAARDPALFGEDAVPDTLEGRFDLLGAPEHRAVAREAVRKSLVLLKNNGVLPVKSSARVLVAGADEDRSFPPEQKVRLEAALQAAGVEAEVVIYPGARHGYAPADMAAYDAEASERHWREMFDLFDATLKG